MNIYGTIQNEHVYGNPTIHIEHDTAVKFQNYLITRRHIIFPLSKEADLSGA